MQQLLEQHMTLIIPKNKQEIFIVIKNHLGFQIKDTMFCKKLQINRVSFKMKVGEFMIFMILKIQCMSKVLEVFWMVYLK